MVGEEKLVQPPHHSEIDAQTLQPQQEHRCHGGSNRLPQTPSVGSCCQDEYKKQEKRIALTNCKKRDQRRPQHIGSVRQPAKRCSRLLVPPEENNNENALNDVESE